MCKDCKQHLPGKAPFLVSAWHNKTEHIVDVGSYCTFERAEAYCKRMKEQCKSHSHFIITNTGLYD